MYFKVNFGALHEQIEIIKQIRDLLEVRPSRQSRSLSVSIDSVESRQAIEGLTSEERQRAKQLCQAWWDSSNEDHSFFRMALLYQQYVEQESLNGNYQVLNPSDSDVVEETHKERAACMRRCVVLQAAVIGLTAFYSMLTRVPSPDESFDLGLDMRQMLHLLLKITYD